MEKPADTSIGLALKIILLAALVLLVVLLFWALLITPVTTTVNGTASTLTPTVSLKTSGAFALYPLMVKWAEEYNKARPDVAVEVSAGGAGKGMTDALTGMVDFGMVSRDITKEEEAQGAFYVAVTKDAVVSVVNEDNPVYDEIMEKGIDKGMFYSIFIEGNVTTWGEVVGDPAVKDRIAVYSRSDACGAADTWAKYMGRKQEDLLGIGVYGDPGLLEAVRKDPLGIGYNNIGYAYDIASNAQVEGIGVVPIDKDANGTISSDESFYKTKTGLVEAINTGSYPSPPARMLNLVAKGQFAGEAEEFVRWILSDGQTFVEEAGYVNLPSDVIAQQVEKLG